MGDEERSLRDIWAALSLITRRLDDLAVNVTRLQPAPPPPPPTAGEPLDDAARARLAGLESLLAVGPGLGREEALVLVVDRMIHRAGADCAALFCPTTEGELEAVAQRGFLPGALRIRLEQGIVGRAFLERETIRAGPAHQLADPLLREHALSHAVAVPIRARGELAVGVLLAARRRPGPFGPESLEALTLLADRVALLLGGAGPPAGATAPIAPLAVDLDLGRTAASVAREAAVRLGAPHVALLLAEEGRLTLAAGIGIPSGAVPPDFRAGAIASALLMGQAWVPSEEAGEAALSEFLGAPPRLVVPLAVSGQTVALVVAGGPSPVRPGAIADLILPAAAAIRNARLHAETVAALAELRASAGRAPVPTPQPVRDFANLLAVALARIALVRERVADAATARDLGVAEEAAWRAAEAVRSMLGFAPGHRGDELVPLDLGAVIRAAVQAAQSRWASRGEPAPAVSVDLEPLPPIRGSADDLREALDHLLENAVEAGTAETVISVRARWDGGQRVEVVVEDSGVGMEEAILAQAVEPFFSTKGVGRLGLGLPVAQAIVARHRGTLDLQSVPGQGTTVRLSFPTAGGTRVVGAAPDREAAAARVLVVEDEASVRYALVTLLAQHGHVALAAADGREGLAILHREPVDVVFADLAVPDLSGLELARAVKRIRPGTPVILLTAWPGQLDAPALQESGVDRVMEKPISARTVLAALEAALGLRRAAPS